MIQNKEEFTLLRPMVRGFYDQQHLRTETGNRLCAQYRTKLGLKSSDSEDSDKDAEKILKQLRASYRKLTDGVKKELPTMKQFKGDGIISNYSELVLLSSYIDMEEREARNSARIGAIVKTHPLWDAFLRDVPGCGPMLSACIIGETNIATATYPSSLWYFYGLGVEPDGRGSSKRPEHMYDVPYTDRLGKAQTRKGIRYNPFMKTKMYLLGECMIKAGTDYEPCTQSEYDSLPKHMRKMRVVADSDSDEEVPHRRCQPTGYLEIHHNYRHRLETGLKHASYVLSHSDAGTGLNLPTFFNYVEKARGDGSSWALVQARSLTSETLAWETRDEVKERAIAEDQGLELKAKTTKLTPDGSVKLMKRKDDVALAINDRVIATYTINDSAQHRANMSRRYMVKEFCVDLYNVWRPLEGLPVAPRYSEAKLGIVHGTGQNMPPK